MNLSDLNFRNVTERLKQHVASPEYPGLQRSVTHSRLTELTRANMEAKAAGRETFVADDQTLLYVHDSFLRREFGLLGVGDEYMALKRRFDREMWPEISEWARVNPGMMRFLVEHGVHSSMIIPFMYYEQHCLAMAVTPAHFVGFDCLGRPQLILPHDAMFPFCRDQSYVMIDGRTVSAQEIMKRSKRVLLAAGGLAPELWTNGYPLGQLDQEIVICDTDVSLTPVLEELIGGPLESFGITVWNRDVIGLGCDEAVKGSFDCIIANGFVSYHTQSPQRLDAIFSGFSNLLRPGGELFFDTQNKHPVLLFDVLVLGWPTGMDTLDSPEAAAQLLDPYLTKYGFVGVEHSTESFNPELGEMPAGTFTAAKKAD